MAALLADHAGRTFWCPGQILLHCELAQYSEAIETLDRLGDLYAIADDDLRPISLVYLAEACVALEDQYRCEQLHRMLRPYRGLNATVPGTSMVGAMSGYLARLSVVLHRFVEAEELLHEAIALNTAMAARPALAPNLLDLSRLLQRSGKRSWLEESAVHLEFASQIARNLNLRPMIREIEASQSPATESALTTRELDVLRLVALGSSNKHIAGHLHISYSTVATHLRNILRKTGASNRTEAVEWARRSRLLDHG